MTRIMVINDTEEILDLFREILEDEGYEVSLHAYRVREMDEIRAVAPDLIIVDQLFGAVQSGWQLIQKLKMTTDLRDIPVVLCTADKRTVDELEGHLMAHGVLSVLKPFDIEDLLRAVSIALRSQPARRRDGKADEATEKAGDATA